MKTKRIVPVILSLFITATAVAQKPYQVATINKTVLDNSFQVSVAAGKTPGLFSLWIQNPERKKLSLQIIHRNSGMVIDTTIMTEQFNKRYNMEQADDGEYTVVVSCGKEKVVREMELNTVIIREVVVH